MEAKYDKIGIGYNRTRKADPYLVSRFCHHLYPLPGKSYLDIGCGTGNYTIALHESGIRFTGVDPSHEMLDRAKEKCPSVSWVSGVVEEIPFADATFDGAIAGLTVHHWNDIARGFRELARVLKSGARLVIFTSDPAQMQRYWLNHYFPVMLQQSCDAMPQVQLLERELQNAGFRLRPTEKFFVTNNLQDLFLQSGKYKPELYLDEQVRKGISSFAALSNREEVMQGLKRLEKDIASGEIKAVINRYESDVGDYLYLVAEKNS